MIFSMQRIYERARMGSLPLNGERVGVRGES